MNNFEITKLNIAHKLGDKPYFGVYNGVITEHRDFPYKSFYKGNPVADVVYIDSREAGCTILDKNVFFKRHLNGGSHILIKNQLSDGESQAKEINQYSNLNDTSSPHYDKTGNNDDHFYKLYTDVVGNR